MSLLWYYRPAAFVVMNVIPHNVDYNIKNVVIFYFQTCSWLHKGLARMPIICTFTDYGYGVTKHHGPKCRSFRDLFWQITNILQQPIAMPKCISRWPQRASDLNSGPILGAGPSAPAGPVLTARSVGNLYLFSCCSMLILFFL